MRRKQKLKECESICFTSFVSINDNDIFLSGFYFLLKLTRVMRDRWVSVKAGRWQLM